MMITRPPQRIEESLISLSLSPSFYRRASLPQTPLATTTKKKKKTTNTTTTMCFKKISSSTSRRSRSNSIVPNSSKSNSKNSLGGDGSVVVDACVSTIVYRPSVRPSRASASARARLGLQSHPPTVDVRSTTTTSDECVRTCIKLNAFHSIPFGSVR